MRKQTLTPIFKTIKEISIVPVWISILEIRLHSYYEEICTTIFFLLLLRFYNYTMQ